MLSLEVVGPGDGLSTVPSQAVTVTAAYSYDMMVAGFFFGWGTAGGNIGGAAPASDGDGLKIYYIRLFRTFGLYLLDLNSPIFGLFHIALLFIRPHIIVSIRPEKSAYFS
jgi:hypothetical protein